MGRSAPHALKNICQNCMQEQLNQFADQHKDARLIIIDTLQKVKEIDGDKFSYANH